MPASEFAYPDDPDGTPNPATTGKMAEPTHRRIEPSEQAYPHGAYGTIPIDRTPFHHYADDQRDT